MLTGSSNGKPWTGSVSTMPLKITQYGRLEGSLDIPAQVTVKGLTAKVVDGSTVRAGQSIKL
jgi:hypothetical protein